MSTDTRATSTHPHPKALRIKTPIVHFSSLYVPFLQIKTLFLQNCILLYPFANNLKTYL